MRKISALVAVFVMTMALWTSHAAAATSLRCTAEIDKPAIRLSDLFDKVPTAIDRDIATSPAPGKSYTYDANALNKLAQQYRIDWQAESVADHCVIGRASSQITIEAIGKAVTDKIRSSFKDLDGAQVEAIFDNRNLIIHLPTDQSPNFTLSNFDYDARSQRFKSDLVAGIKGSQVVQSISGRVAVKRDVPVLLQRLEAKTVIGEADLGWVTMSSERISSDMIISSSALIGKELRRDIAENQPIRTRDIIQPRLVTRGSLVNMLVETPYMRITSQGRSLQDGSMGETVRIANTQSKKVVEGTVTGQGTVKINISEMMPPKQASVTQPNKNN